MSSAPPSSLTPTLRATAATATARRSPHQPTRSARPAWLSRTATTALGALRFTAMTVVGMAAVWALVLLFG